MSDETTQETPGTVPQDAAPAATVAPTVILSEADLSAIRTKVENDLRQLLLSEYEARREGMIADMKARWKEEADLTDFVTRSTSTGEHALPVAPAELEEFLRGMTQDLRTKTMALLGKITTAGTIDFSEIGTSAAAKPESHDLPDFASQALRTFIANGGSTATFFEANPELGTTAQYDLKAYGG